MKTIKMDLGSLAIIYKDAVDWMTELERADVIGWETKNGDQRPVMETAAQIKSRLALDQNYKRMGEMCESMRQIIVEVHVPDTRVAVDMDWKPAQCIENLIVDPDKATKED